MRPVHHRVFLIGPVPRSAMHIDANLLEDDSLIEGDLCIVGAGAAGISMALEWAHASHKVILLEGGGFEVDAGLQDLYRGEIVGQKYYPLQSSRLHYFGGTTGHWGGFCARFDPWDFEKRDWVPHSGWPIRLADLDPFYERAQALVEIGPSEKWEADYWAKKSPNLAPLPFDKSKVWTKMWQFSAPTRFGTRYREDIVASKNIHLFTHANICDIKTNDVVSNVEELEIRCLNGRKHRVRSRYVVLACGAIQNARLLLSSNGQAPRGLGNDHDLVGRFFMEHIEAPVAYFAVASAAPLSLYVLSSESYAERKARGELVLSYAQQRDRKLLNCSADLSPAFNILADDETNRIDAYPQTAQGVLDWVDGLFEAMDRGDMDEPDLTQVKGFSMQCRSETAPNPQSRVLLGEEKDALGMPRVELNWQLTELDKRTLVETLSVIGEEAGRTGLGRIKIREWLLEDDPFSSPRSLTAAGWHHMGTARMHDDPRHGVVDATCRVHGLENLYVAGSAAFSTSGVANPTLTLIALTLRLSDHLKERIA